jgi:hypothetical protein
VSANALKLKRVVEMYQWKETSRSETKKKIGGGSETVTTYAYSRGWSEGLIASEHFRHPTGHRNPGRMAFKSMQKTAGTVRLGAFVLPPFMVDRIDTFESLPFPHDAVLPKSLGRDARVSASGVYIGDDPASPRLGDIRVMFKIVRPTAISVIAGLSDNTFEPFATDAGGTIALLETGVHASDDMIQRAQTGNTMMTWLLRAGGLLFMVAGLNLILKPLAVIADVLPLLGRLVGAGTGLIAFLLAGILSLVTIAVAWLFYRPVAGGILILAAAGLAVWLRLKLRPPAGNAVPPPPPSGKKHGLDQLSPGGAAAGK